MPSLNARVARQDEAVEALRTLGRKPDQLVHVRIHVHHAVECHDVGRRDRLRELHEVAVSVRDSATEAAALALLTSRLEVGRGCVDAHRLGRASVEQLMLDRADPAADVEQRRALNAFGF